MGENSNEFLEKNSNKFFDKISVRTYVGIKKNRDFQLSETLFVLKLISENFVSFSRFFQ